MFILIFQSHRAVRRKACSESNEKLHMSPRHTANPDSASEAPNGQMKNNRPTPKRRSTTSDAIETAEAIKKESRELCDELDVNLKKLRTVIERSRGNGSRTNVIELWMK